MGTANRSSAETLPSRRGGPAQRRRSTLSKVILAFVQAAFVAGIALAPIAVAPVIAANPAANLDQGANGSTGTEPTINNATYSNWINGNLGSSKSRYFEGDSIPYRLVFTNLVVGSNTVTFGWDTTKGGKHAIDYLTTWDRSTQPGSSATADVLPGSPAGTPFLIPADSNVTGAGVTQIAGNFTMYNGTITLASAYTLSGSYAGDSSTSITLTFTASDPTVVLAWGGHIASRVDWGANNSAVAISGSPYHTALLDLNGQGGKQDRSLSENAVIFPASITIVKNTTGGNATFDFTASPSPLTNFAITTSGGTGSQPFPGVTSFTTYTVTESAPPQDWTFTSLACSVTSPNGGTQSISGATATINLHEGENVTCTYVNTANPADLTITKGVSLSQTGPSSQA